MEGLIRQLRAIGFTEMEAKIMIILSEQGMMTGYEVAKRLGVSRSNVYAALQRLVDQGYVLITQGEPTYYRALDVHDLTRMMNERMQYALSYVETHMPKGVEEAGGVFTIEGEKMVLAALRRCTSQAKYEIIVDAAPQEAVMIQEDLLQAEARGVRVLWTLSGGESDNWAIDSLADVRNDAGPNRFVMVMDRRQALIGMRSNGRYTKALMTDHPAITDLLLSHFIQDIILYELEQLMDDSMREQAGPQFSNLIDPYLRA